MQIIKTIDVYSSYLQGNLKKAQSALELEKRLNQDQSAHVAPLQLKTKDNRQEVLLGYYHGVLGQTEVVWMGLSYSRPVTLWVFC